MSTANKVHVVRPGECLSTIALHHGFRDYRTVYNHSANAALRKKRPDPNLIHPGDEVVIPALAPKRASAATGASHEFVAVVPKRVLRLTLHDSKGEPLKNAAYELRFGREQRAGQTDGDGLLEEPIPMHLTAAELETDELIWELDIGHLNPVEDTPDLGVTGLQSRLRNLGYRVGPIDGHLGTRTRSALQAFQAEHRVPVTGVLDAKTIAKIKEAHGS